MSKDWVRMWCMAFEDLVLVKVNVGYMRGQIHYYISELLKLLWVHVSTHLLVSMPKNWRRPSLSHWTDYSWRPSSSHGQWRWLRTKFDQVLLIFPRLLFHTLTLQATAQPVRGKWNLWPFSYFECKFLIYFLDEMGAKNCHLQQTSLVKILSTRKTMRAQARISLRNNQIKRWGWEDCCKKIKGLMIDMQHNGIVLHGVVCF